MPIKTPFYPLRFAPIFQYRLWGGRRLADIVSAPLPPGPVGEAWILSDRDDFPSRVDDGSLEGKTIKQLLDEAPEEMLGQFVGRHRRFPLLLKFLDAREMLSVQVHPTDEQKEYLPPGELGKTEAWVVLQADPSSRIYAGLRPGTTEDDLRSLTAATADSHLSYFHPKVGEGVFLPAGTVHALGDGVAVFEVQQNSDVTFRLYDWDRVDPSTNEPRELHVEQAIACTDFGQGIVGPVRPILTAEAPVRAESVFQTEHFWVNRYQGELPFPVGVRDAPRVVVCVEGKGLIECSAAFSSSGSLIRRGNVFLLPPVLAGCVCRPDGPMTLLEIGLPGDTSISFES